MRSIFTNYTLTQFNSYFQASNTYFFNNRLLDAKSTITTINSIANWSPSATSVRLSDNLRCHIPTGGFGSGFSGSLRSFHDATRTSFSAWNGSHMGATGCGLISKGTISIPSSILLIKHVPELALELLLEWASSRLTGNVVKILGSDCMLAIALYGNGIDSSMEND